MPIIPAVKVIVHNDDRITIVTDRTPTDIGRPAVPMYPGGSPATTWNPVPSQSKPPVPSPVMADAPTPGFVRNPAPTEGQMPAPSSIVIGPPGVVIDMRYPNVSIGRLIDPVTVIGQFFLIRIELCGKISPFDRSTKKFITGPVPIGEIIDLPGTGVLGAYGENPVCSG